MKILIVDDEDYTREGLLEGIDWKELGVEEVMQARNGMEALNLSKWFKPDIVLTDIRMPKLDGMEFAREMVRMNSFCKIIFMSGYMEVEYLKNAIQLSAVDYIEKPIDIRIVQEAVKKAAGEIQERKRNLTISENVKELKQQKLANLLILKENNDKAVTELVKEVGFPSKGSYVCLEAYMKVKQDNPETLIGKIQDFFLKKGFEVLCDCEKGEKYFIILSYKKADRYRLGSLYQSFLETFPEIVLGIGFETENVRNIYNSYQTAELALNLSFYDESSRLFHVDDEILIHRSIDPGVFGEFMGVLKEEPLELAHWNKKLFEDLKLHKYFRKEQVQTLLVSLIMEIFRSYPELFHSYTEFKSLGDIGTLVHEFDYLSEIKGFMEDLISKLEEKYLKVSRYSRIIKGAMDYIAQNYSNPDLSVVEIASYLNFTATYLNVLFKQEIKVTLKQYLSNYRLEKAKRMLESDFNKITDIAEKCGYANANYFAKVFKEMTGMTPVEYRNRK